MANPVATPSRREPVTLAAGDQVNFVRSLSKYLATDGFSISYEALGGGTNIQWASAVDADGKSFDVIIPSATTAAYVPGEYELNGYATNAATGERYQFYSNVLTVTPNLQNLPADFDTSTHASRMLAHCEATLERMAQHDLNDSTTEQVEFHRKKVKEMTDLRDSYLRERENELQKEAAIAGRPNRKKIKLRLLVTNPAFGLNQFGAGNNQENFR